MQWAENPQLLGGTLGLVDPTAMLGGAEPESLPEITESFLLDVLAALVDMALRSKRRQADLGAALRHARINAPRDLQHLALGHIEARGWVSKIVPLCDGGVLLSVTAQGLEQFTGAVAA